MRLRNFPQVYLAFRWHLMPIIYLEFSKISFPK